MIWRWLNPIRLARRRGVHALLVVQFVIAQFGGLPVYSSPTKEVARCGCSLAAERSASCCCKSQTRSAKSCCQPKLAGKSTPGKPPSRKSHPPVSLKAETATGTWTLLLSSDMRECRGMTPLWSVLADSLTPPPLVRWEFQTDSIDRLQAISAKTPRTFRDPPVPPPRLRG